MRNNLAFEHRKHTKTKAKKGGGIFDHPMEMCHKESERENWDEDVTLTKADQERAGEILLGDDHNLSKRKEKQDIGVTMCMRESKRV